jgi:hypothetical protein
VGAPGRHLEYLAGAVGMLAARRGDRHRAFENKQPGVEFVGVRTVDRAWLHPSIDHFAITFFAQLSLEHGPIHDVIPSGKFNIRRS